MSRTNAAFYLQSSCGSLIVQKDHSQLQYQQDRIATRSFFLLDKSSEIEFLNIC